MQEKKIDKLLCKKVPKLDGLGNSQPIQIAKDTKIRTYTVRKGYSKEKAKDVTEHPLVSSSEG